MKKYENPKLEYLLFPVIDTLTSSGEGYSDIKNSNAKVKEVDR